jgi:photosystem II stability/assembly factor-like uncharacterized protein
MSVQRRCFPLVVFLAVLGSSGPAWAQWQAIGPYGGHAQIVAIDPADHYHLYTATKQGQIYQSLDAGQWWRPLPFALNLDAYLSALVINPKNSSELFVGVARNFATVDASGETSGDSGVYKTTDAGQHWTRVPSTKGWSVLSLAIHPVQTNLVIAGTEEGVFRSEDEGLTWKQISPQNHRDIKSVVSVAVDPSNSRVLYAGTTHLPWKTSDGGLTWQSIHVGMADDSDVFSMTINSASPGSLLLGACSGIYRTDSGGTRWSAIPGIPDAAKRTHQVVQDPVNAMTFYAATVHGLWKSVDAGRTWKQTNPYPYVINSIAIDSKKPQIIYLATDRSGILKSTNGGATFTAINQGFVNRNLGRLVSKDLLYVTSLYDGDFGGVFATSDRGLTWTLNANQDALHGKNITSLAVAPGNSARLLAGTYDGLLSSTDRGKSWNLVGAFNTVAGGNGRIYDVSFSQTDPNMVYLATDHGLFTSTDDAASWNRNPSVAPDTAVYKLLLDTSDSGKLIIQTSRGVLISRDGGLQWAPLNVDAGTPIYDVAFSNMPRGRILVASWRGLLYFEDGSEDWMQVEGGLPVSQLDQILCVPGRPDEMYVLSRRAQEMWRSVNAGRDWEKVETRGLEGTLLRSIGVEGEQPFVVTENHGVFRLDTPHDLVQALRQTP